MQLSVGAVLKKHGYSWVNLSNRHPTRPLRIASRGVFFFLLQ